MPAPTLQPQRWALRGSGRMPASANASSAAARANRCEREAYLSSLRSLTSSAASKFFTSAPIRVGKVLASKERMAATPLAARTQIGPGGGRVVTDGRHHADARDGDSAARRHDASLRHQPNARAADDALALAGLHAHRGRLRGMLAQLCLDFQQLARRRKRAQFHIRNHAQRPRAARGGGRHFTRQRRNQFQTGVNEQGARKNRATRKMVGEKITLVRNLQGCDRLLARLALGRWRGRSGTPPKAPGTAPSWHSSAKRARSASGSSKSIHGHHRPHAMVQPDDRNAIDLRGASVRHRVRIHRLQVSSEFEPLARLDGMQQGDFAARPATGRRLKSTRAMAAHAANWPTASATSEVAKPSKPDGIKYSPRMRIPGLTEVIRSTKENARK